ncbi:hypothetical protein BU15DRAFT_68900 [Melanogaster broomeanus]|nr:hypothetical protein BU15DRAFT_68900 [Melanogaster broomeanus]
MSSASKIIIPASSMSSVDWARFKTPELDSDIEDDDEIAMAKAKERRRHKVEKKRREDEEARLREEEEKRRREEEEKHLWEEQEKCLREEQEAEAEHKSCVRCARAGVPCEFTNDGNKRRTVCDRCAAQREKCEWPEMHAPGTGKGKAKAKEVPTLPRQGEKKKRVCKAKAQDDDEVEIVGESRSGAGPSWVSLDRLVMAIEEMSDRMGELVQVHRESMQAHWQSTQVHWESMQALRKARRAFEIFVDEAAICGTPEESEEESSEEEVDEGELQEELAGLDEEQAENPMSPPRKQVT